MRHRRCTTSELFLYLSAWAACMACFSVDDANLLSTAGIILLPGTLVLGPTFGNRRLLYFAASVHRSRDSVSSVTRVRPGRRPSGKKLRASRQASVKRRLGRSHRSACGGGGFAAPPTRENLIDSSNTPSLYLGASHRFSSEAIPDIEGSYPGSTRRLAGRSSCLADRGRA